MQDKIPAYLESTMDAKSIYERLGFTTAEKISMVLEGRQGESVVYDELCFIFRPSATPYAIPEHIQSTI